jgi:hypothetical protein
MNFTNLGISHDISFSKRGLLENPPSNSGMLATFVTQVGACSPRYTEKTGVTFRGAIINHHKPTIF